MDGLDEDLLGDTPAQGDGRVRAAVADKERPPEDGLSVELDDVVPVEAEGHEAPANALAPGEVNDPQGRTVGGVEQVHECTNSPVYPIMPLNQGNFSVSGK
jgi:hypothetical protein